MEKSLVFKVISTAVVLLTLFHITFFGSDPIMKALLAILVLLFSLNSQIGYIVLVTVATGALISTFHLYLAALIDAKISKEQYDSEVMEAVARLLVLLLAIYLSPNFSKNEKSNI